VVDLVISPEQQQIVDSVVDYLAAEMPVRRLRPDAAERSDAGHWRAMGELGWFMLALPEEHGGVGLTATEEALLFRELGRHLLTPNVLAQTLGARVAAAAGSDRAGAVAAGEEQVALALRRAGSNDDDAFAGRFQIIDAGDAPLVLIVEEDGRAALIETRVLNGRQPLSSAVDRTTIELATISSPAATVATAAPSAGVHTRLRLLAAAMLSGVCAGTRDLASEYAKMRMQFGQPIGAFQAIKHKCADMAVRADAVAALVDYASICVATDRADAVFQATSAKLLSGRYALTNAKETIQVHGAIGWTVEADAHHFLKRAHLYDQIGGGSRRQQQLLLAEAAPAAESVA
jgi:alkylation response protein AidB-like acyl-CoA dehydrogenase